MFNVEYFGEKKKSKLSNYVEDNMTKKGVDKQFQSFDLKFEKIVANNDLLVKNEDLSNKNIEDIVISDNSHIMKDYFEVSLYTKLK
jgi:hypothetical protein